MSGMMRAMIVLAALCASGCDASPAQPGAGHETGTAKSAATASGARHFNAGMWDITTTVNGRKMPTSPTCVGAADAAAINSPDSQVAAGLARATPQGCQVKNVVIAGQRVTFDTICSGVSTNSSIVYSGDRYSGTMIVAGAQRMQVDGRRIGSCPSQ